MRRSVVRWGVTAAVAALVTSACSSGGGGGTGLTGKVLVSGSSTVEPISSLVSEDFHAAQPDVSVTVNGPGTSDGFVLFCKGQTDINDASRPIKDEEIQACKQGGVHYTQLEVGLDGITVMTNPANESVNCLSKADLYALVGPESQGFTSWADANALDKELGGRGNFPDVPLDITAPGEESGTYDAFIELALKDIADERGQADDQTRPDYQSSANDNVIIQGIEGSDSSFGWVGYAYAEENAGGVKIVQVDPAEDASSGCVGPNRDTIADGSYPLSRSLYIYVNTDRARSNKALQAYVDFYVNGLGDYVDAAGYVDLPQDRIDKTRSEWETAV